MSVFVNRLFIYAKNISGRIMAVALDEKNLVAGKWELVRFFSRFHLSYLLNHLK